jgi:hypothetical protein
MKPHKHAALIKQWADGHEIEKQANTGEWFIDCRPDWHEYGYYRIEPEPKPDVVRNFEIHIDGSVWLNTTNMNIRLTFSGENNKLKSAEVI